MTSKQEILLKAVREDAPSKAGLFKAVFEGGTRGKAIKAFCLYCCWMDVNAISYCTATECPLWGFRPYQKKGEKCEEPE